MLPQENLSHIVHHGGGQIGGSFLVQKGDIKEVQLFSEQFLKDHNVHLRCSSTKEMFDVQQALKFFQERRLFPTRKAGKFMLWEKEGVRRLYIEKEYWKH